VVGGSPIGDVEVTLQFATAEHGPVLSNLLELYLHELSDIFQIDTGADGRFGYDGLPLYWSDPDTHHAFLIRSGDRIGRFALVTRGSPATDDPDDLDVAEFFVLRSHRRSGVGRAAAFLLWNRISGRWIVRVSEANRAGRSFWESIVREYTGGVFAETTRPGRVHMFRVFSFDGGRRSST
jgi:predicted acetyltransferase